MSLNEKIINFDINTNNNNIMKKIKQLGIFMDHAHAFLMELENGLIISRNIVSGWEDAQQKDKEDNDNTKFNSSEKKFLQSAFYKEISNIMRHYQQVVLFGPTDAKNELYNLVRTDHNFENTIIELKTTDEMSATDRQKFVVRYFKSA